MVERRVPATIPQDKRRSTTRSRYHLADPYLRFYFRFIEPYLEMIELGRADLLWERIAEPSAPLSASLPLRSCAANGCA
jgi:hypothetical protein